MNLTNDCTESEQTFFRRRFHAAVGLRGLSIEGMARACEVTSRHLFYVITGKRQPSAKLRDKVRALLGDAAWRFVTGEVATLADEGAHHAA